MVTQNPARGRPKSSAGWPAAPSAEDLDLPRPWFRKKRFLVPTGAFVLVSAIATPGGGEGVPAPSSSASAPLNGS